MSKLNHLHNAEKILYIIKHIRNGGICNESLSEYTIVSASAVRLDIKRSYLCFLFASIGQLVAAMSQYNK